jgi:hypothetical protein
LAGRFGSGSPIGARYPRTAARTWRKIEQDGNAVILGSRPVLQNAGQSGCKAIVHNFVVIDTLPKIYHYFSNGAV